MKEQKTKVDIDPITGEISTTIIDEEEEFNKQLWDKTPMRTQAIRDLIFDDMLEEIKKSKVPEDKKAEMIFLMTTSSIIDLFVESLPLDLALDATFFLDHMIGLALTNKKYGVDIISESKKAMETVDPTQFKDADEYEAALEEFEERWWEMGQPALGMRSPNDAIYEMLSKYKLNEE